jgi:hypothetical protein
MHRLQHTIDTTIKILAESWRFTTAHNKLAIFGLIASTIFSGTFVLRSVQILTTQSNLLSTSELTRSVDGLSYALTYTANFIAAASGQGFLFAISLGVLILAFLAIGAVSIHILLTAAEVGTKRQVKPFKHLPNKRQFVDIVLIAATAWLLTFALSLAAAIILKGAAALAGSATIFISLIVLAALLPTIIAINATGLFSLVEVTRGETHLNTAFKKAVTVVSSHPIHLLEFGVLIALAQTAAGLIFAAAAAVLLLIVAVLAASIVELGIIWLGSAVLILGVLTVIVSGLLIAGMLTVFTYRAWVRYYDKLVPSGILSVTRHVLKAFKRT